MKLQKNVSLRDKNWFKTGGNAVCYCEPSTPEEFALALTHANAHDLAIAMLGEGANILISDDGFDGLVIRPAIKGATLAEEKLVTVGAGVSIQECIDWCLEHNLVGLEEFSGIPGTIGGALYINIHYFQSLISEFVVLAQVINKKTGEIKMVDNAWFQFGYDQSTLQKGEWYLLYATLELTKANKIEAAYARGRRDEIIRQRNSRYPTARTCGSFFRNFEENELDGVMNAKWIESTCRKLPFIAYYLDKLGVKGVLSYGGAIVSRKHANMIETKENATSHDVIMLARKMQELVFDNFGLVPQAECQFIGFDPYPLYQPSQTKPTISQKTHPVHFPPFVPSDPR